MTVKCSVAPRQFELTSKPCDLKCTAVLRESTVVLRHMLALVRVGWNSVYSTVCYAVVALWNTIPSDRHKHIHVLIQIVLQYNKNTDSLEGKRYSSY